MTSRTRLIALPLMVLLLPSCGWRDWQKDSSANKSALYDPPHVTLVPGMKYQFLEGQFVGDGRKFHSEYSYRRAVIVGNQ